jgi:membrane-associated phospholipid phosphatase
VAFAVFTAVWLRRILRQMGAGRVVRALNWLWCLGILYSTVAIRQHVALDVLTGTVLGATVAVVHLRLLRAFPGPPQV